MLLDDSTSVTGRIARLWVGSPERGDGPEENVPFKPEGNEPNKPEGDDASL